MQAEVPGFGKAILANLRADEDLVRGELDRHRVPAIVRATVDEMIRVRALSLQRPIYEEWSNGRREWVSRWIDEMQLARPSEADLQENWDGGSTGGLGIGRPPGRTKAAQDPFPAALQQAHCGFFARKRLSRSGTKGSVAALLKKPRNPSLLETEPFHWGSGRKETKADQRPILPATADSGVRSQSAKWRGSWGFSGSLRIISLIRIEMLAEGSRPTSNLL